MRLQEADTSTPELVAGPSNSNNTSTNGHTNGIALNGHDVLKSPYLTPTTTTRRVSLPGNALYTGSEIQRDEFVRLVVQTLRDVGYIESAATLEAESGYALEVPEIRTFRQAILDGVWSDAEQALGTLDELGEPAVKASRFLISQQKFLELLEEQKTTAALRVLRNELATYDEDLEKLHALSSLMMCSTPEDLRQRAQWDGGAGTSRRRLLSSLQVHIPPSLMIPERRFETLLQQARLHQQQTCLYHNTRDTFSLYSNHTCSRAQFPTLTTHILAEHDDEVWSIAWSHDGTCLASASKDKSAIIWKSNPLGPSAPTTRWTAELVLRDHPFHVGALAWSLDDTILLTSAEQIIKMWNAKTGVCLRDLCVHTDTVTSLHWLPDNSGFVSASMDRHVIFWNTDGKQRDEGSQLETPIRITDLCVAPDMSRFVAVGFIHALSLTEINPQVTDNRVVVYDLNTRQEEASMSLEKDLTSVKVSRDSRYALISHAANELQLWNIENARMSRKFTGQHQGHDVIRSGFGGIDDNFVLSGSEDGKVYVWHCDTGTVLEVLEGHGDGSVNSVAWNPCEPRMFASCSDDHTVRIWEAPDSAILGQDSETMNGIEKDGVGRSFPVPEESLAEALLPSVLPST